MATERNGDTVIKVYTANRPPEDDTEYIKRSARREEQMRRTSAFGGIWRWRRRTVEAKPRAVKRRVRPVRPPMSRRRARNQTDTSGKIWNMTRLKREALVACSLLMCAVSLKVMPFPWAQRATEAMSGAVNMSVDLDKTLGQLRFVKQVIPDSVMVFWNGGSGSEYSAPFSGNITHSYSESQPWLEYAGQNQAVKSARAGEVIQIEQGASGDWAVRIRHDGDIETVYAFLSDVSVNVGDSVAAAQEIGRAEGTNGARIYFEMRSGGKPVDPSPYLGIG